MADGGLISAAIPCSSWAQAKYSRTALASPTIADPISVYDNWAAYDELSDNVPLTEELTLRELDNVLRLERDGVRFDYYVMDAFWFDPDSGYRTWKKPNWPQGPDRWIKMCRRMGFSRGFGSARNTLVHLNAVPKWRDSLNKSGTAMSMFEGGFLPDFMDVLQYWYDRGIRMFLFDFADMTAATPKSEASLSKQEIVKRNSMRSDRRLAAFVARILMLSWKLSTGSAATWIRRTIHFPSRIRSICNGFRSSTRCTAAIRARAMCRR